MRIAVMGTGGVGGYFGTRLALDGCDVSFIARGRGQPSGRCFAHCGHPGLKVRYRLSSRRSTLVSG